MIFQKNEVMKISIQVMETIYEFEVTNRKYAITNSDVSIPICNAIRHNRCYHNIVNFSGVCQILYTTERQSQRATGVFFQ